MSQGCDCDEWSLPEGSCKYCEGHRDGMSESTAAVKAERERIAGLLTKMADGATSCWTCGHSISASDLSRFVDEELGAP